jgi:hypothetical protein
VWLAAPRGRAERIRRRLTIAAQNARDIDSAKTIMGILLPPRPARPDPQGAPGSTPDAITKARHGVERVVREAGAACAVDAQLAAASWKGCSSLTRSRIWASINLLDREEVARIGNVAEVRMTASAVNVATRTGVSVMFIHEARRLFTLRASAHT